MKKKLPSVAIVGRTNAGKSTLFNRLTETRKAIVSPLVNTTRDRNFADIMWQDRIFNLVDTGGLDTAGEDELSMGIKKQVALAIKDASILLFIVDGSEPLMPQDKEMAKYLHKLNKPVILGINKIDNHKKDKKIDADFYKLNFEKTVKFSAINGSQTGDLLDVITNLLPKKKILEREEKNILKLSIIGRPNVGKSSIINSIIGEERFIASEQAHTTRDINDIEFDYKDKQIVLIDTAGLRKKSKVGNWSDKLISKIEKEGTSASVRALDESDVVIIVLEAQKRVTSQDQTLVQLAMNHNKKIICVINKWDLIPEKDEKTINKYIKYFDNNLPFAKWVPLIFTSALTKQRVKNILDLALEIDERSKTPVDEEVLMEIMQKVKNKYNPKQKQVRTWSQPKKELKFKKLIQTETDPPRFNLKTPTPKNVPTAIVRIIEKELREKFEFLGIPIKIDVTR